MRGSQEPQNTVDFYISFSPNPDIGALVWTSSEHGRHAAAREPAWCALETPSRRPPLPVRPQLG